MHAKAFCYAACVRMYLVACQLKENKICLTIIAGM